MIQAMAWTTETEQQGPKKQSKAAQGMVLGMVFGLMLGTISGLDEEDYPWLTWKRATWPNGLVIRKR
jgi:hypothetical protein